MSELVIMVCGDSISGCGSCWPYQMMGTTYKGDCGAPDVQTSVTYLSGALLLNNMAISGSKLSGNSIAVSTIRPAYVDPVYSVKALLPQTAATSILPAVRKYLYINAIGANDQAIDGYATPALYAVAVATDIAAGKSAGADFGWICTLTSQAGAGQARIDAYNTTITDPSWLLAHGVDACLDLASAAHAGPQFLPANSGGDTTWYHADNLHPQAVLQAEMAAIALAKVTALLAII